MLKSAPKHIAIIMDGNGRWAKKRFMPRLAGHRAGRSAVRKVIEFAARHTEIEALTLFAFSTENWARPPEEVEGLMKLFSKAMAEESESLVKNSISLRFMGDIDGLSLKLRTEMRATEATTAGGKRLTVRIAVNYGGRADIAQACKQLAGQAARGEISTDDITEEKLSSVLYSSDVPEPELFIRSGGESRISNFLLWDLAYSELYFTDMLWPDFDGEAMQSALDWYAQRQRRFGKTGEQVENN